MCLQLYICQRDNIICIRVWKRFQVQVVVKVILCILRRNDITRLWNSPKIWQRISHWEWKQVEVLANLSENHFLPLPHTRRWYIWYASCNTSINILLKLSPDVKGGKSYRLFVGWISSLFKRTIYFSGAAISTNPPFSLARIAVGNRYFVCWLWPYIG